MPLLVVTVMSTVPVPAGDAATMALFDLGEKLAAETNPKSTAVAPTSNYP